ncbi:MAG: 50S ribosomal protein L3 [Caldisphaera sp.]|jgi:large subunit ribosomal protein L3|nr:50S ribosomal protein L3 [Caldisphaera sp.]
MGHRKKSAARRGSLGFYPRMRTEEFVPKIKSWPTISLQEPKLLGFIGYKVGMTHIFMIEDRQGLPNFGKEVIKPVTIIETPPIYVLAVRGYGFDLNKGLYPLTEAWGKIPEEIELQRRIPTQGEFKEENKKELQKKASEIKEVRVLIASQPKLTGGLSKKIPDILEIKVGSNDIKKALDFALNKLGQQVTAKEVFMPGQVIDVLSVTKGKGWQGVIKRAGAKQLPRWTKHRKGSRKIGARSHGLGTWWENPSPGQLGFHRRTEYNKRILDIGEDGYKITPAGGFVNYGIVKSPYLILDGSIPGITKRPVVLRYPIRPPIWYASLGIKKPQITFISLSSKQGV